MKVALLQAELIWEDANANRQMFEQMISKHDATDDLIILPEMFTTGFTMNAERVAESMDGETVSWLKNLALQRNSAITGSIVVKENQAFYNRLLFVYPDGNLLHYDKRHLFTLAGEHHVYTRGNDRHVINYLGWKICLLICYDLRFPVFSRYQGDYDMLIYVANWPSTRITAWNKLLPARAIENMSYVIGVNRIGTDGNNVEYPGNTRVVDPLGVDLITTSEEVGVFTTTLAIDNLRAVRDKFGFLNDRDTFMVM